ncbi:hypothetical protein KGP24_23335 (plasmid) [Enterobacter sp. JBIWA008]|uniref:hypothetical protein n=1 Tax=Enterobacter sp. JBIWA008 TaxID=2831892 RepID=UPI001CC13BA6|nr:hypothetical protein [Enterobacter sp. JBIWA008]UAN43335.1 hypothetical protein KGP24_23335 [Enterobacter sp. JBIWA008]
MKTGLILLALLMPVLTAPCTAAVLTGSSVTATRNLNVNASGTASLSVVPVSELPAGRYGMGYVIGSWSASVTAGTVAWRLNPDLVGQYPTPVLHSGFLKNTRNATRQVEVTLSAADCTAYTLTDNWLVCPQGVSSISGTVGLTRSQVIQSGAYRMAVDSVVWAF